MQRAFLLLILGTLLTCPAFAQATGSTNAPTNSPPPSGPPPGGTGGMMPLTPEEMMKLHNAQIAAFAADPSLAATIKDLQARSQALEMKIRDAMIKADASVAPILAKIDAAREHRGMPGNPPPSGNPQPPPPPPPVPHEPSGN